MLTVPVFDPGLVLFLEKNAAYNFAAAKILEKGERGERPLSSSRHDGIVDGTHQKQFRVV